MAIATLFLLLLLTTSSYGTPCDQTCKVSMLVTGLCKDHVCQCKAGARAIDTGCGETTDLDALVPKVVTARPGANSGDPPILSPGLYSGQVKLGSTLILACDSKYVGDATRIKYSWYEGDSTTPMSGEEKQTIVVSEANTATTKKYSCELRQEPVFTSKRSDKFTVDFYDTGANIAQPKVISNVPDGYNVTANTQLIFTCGYLPMDRGVTLTYAWSDDAGTGQELSYASLSLAEAAHPSKKVTCTINGLAGVTISKLTSLPKLLPSASTGTVKAVLDTGVTINVGKGTDFKPSCSLDPNKVFGLPTLDPDTNIKEITVDKQVYKCSSTDSSVVTTDKSVITLVDDQKAQVDLDPKAPVKGGNVTLKCSATPPNTDFAYKWFYDGVLIPGQTDHTLQISKLVSKYNGKYTCLVMKGGQPFASAVAQLIAVPKSGSSAVVISLSTLCVAFLLTRVY